jgi:hypothetical protein
VEEDIRTRIRAGCPALMLVSREEARARKAVERIVTGLGRTLWIHDFTEGLTRLEAEESDPLWPAVRKEAALTRYRDPIAALEHVRKAPPQSSVYLFIEFGAFFADPTVCRHLKRSLEALRSGLNTLILLSDRDELPRNLGAEVEVMDFPLPDRGDLARLLFRVEAALSERRVPLRLEEEDRRRLVEAALGLTWNHVEDAVARSVVRTGCLGRDAVEAVRTAKAGVLRGAAALEAVDASTPMEDVGGLVFFKRWLGKRAEAFSERAGAAGIAPPKGVLLLGVPGCGKSLAAKACGPALGLPVLRLDAGGLFSAEVGSSEARVRDAIGRVEAMAPCVLWVDELEKSMAGMGSGGRSDAGTASRVFAALATWLQERKCPVFVAATANGLADLPPEMIRKGRWDEVFFVDLPGRREREEIFAIHLRAARIDPTEAPVGLLAQASAGFSGADIEQAVSEARLEAFCDHRPLVPGDLLEAIRLQAPQARTRMVSVGELREWARSAARPASPGLMEDEESPTRNGYVRAL